MVIANNDAMAMGAVEALKAHNKSSIPVFGVDALPEALALVKSGALAGTVLNDANNRAKATFDPAKTSADGKGAADGTNWKIDNKVVRVPYVGVDKDNWLNSARNKTDWAQSFTAPLLYGQQGKIIWSAQRLRLPGNTCWK